MDRTVTASFVWLAAFNAANDFKLSGDKRGDFGDAIRARLAGWVGLSTLEAKLDVRSAIRTLAAL